MHQQFQVRLNTAIAEAHTSGQATYFAPNWYYLTITGGVVCVQIHRKVSEIETNLN
jgi:hypothetical protein